MKPPARVRRQTGASSAAPAAPVAPTALPQQRATRKRTAPAAGLAAIAEPASGASRAKNRRTTTRKTVTEENKSEAAGVGITMAAPDDRGAQATASALAPASVAAPIPVQAQTPAPPELVTPAAGAPTETTEEAEALVATAEDNPGKEDLLRGSVVVSDSGVGDSNDRRLCACMLLIDIAAGIDTCCVAQVVRLAKAAAASACDPPGDGSAFALCTTSGPTGGPSPNIFVHTFQTEKEAVGAFATAVHELTGLAWPKACEDNPPVDGMYRYLRQDPDAADEGDRHQAMWQHWSLDKPRGKARAAAGHWKNCSPDLAKSVDELYQDSLINANIYERLLTSGGSTFLLQLRDLTITDLSHRDQPVQYLRRVPPGATPSNVPPNHLPCPIAPTSQPGTTAVKVKSAKPLMPKVQKTPKHVVTKPPPAAVSTVVSKNTCIIPVDSAVSIIGADPHSYSVVADYDVMLNQCNITGRNNNNKMYKIQLLQTGANAYSVWTRWGRVGEPAKTSQARMFGPFETLEIADRTFGSKYKDKTGNKWEDRANFKARSGKYEPVLIDYGANVPDDIDTVEFKPRIKVDHLPCTLDETTKNLIEVIHNRDMMTDAMQTFDIDVKRMPLGALDQAQVERGIDVLDEIKAAISSKDMGQLSSLSSKFYTTIPHAFGRRRPPVIGTEEMLQAKYDMCDILCDIESTSKKLEKQEKVEVKTELVPHPVDKAYSNLGARLELVDKSSLEFKVVSTYFNETRDSQGLCKLQDVWRVQRDGEDMRFKSHSDIENRKLLWHGTRIEVVAAILDGGLRIMPHSGGRVGKGLYLACEQGKSAAYTRGWKGHMACMFLAEAALGNQFEIVNDDPTLCEPPSGFKSVLARGQQAPELYDVLDIDCKKVAVPQGPPVPTGVQSSFSQDEYLVYDESQVHLRYVISLEM
jgi:poly [ADP-ribose] polymerase 2/3/4